MLEQAELDYPAFVLERDVTHKSFPKMEFYDEPKRVRSISGPLLQTRLYFAKMFHHAQRIICDKVEWDVGGCKVLFLKNFSVDKRPAMIDEFLIPNLPVIGTDHSAFEAHMTAQVMREGEIRSLRAILGNAYSRQIEEWVTYVTAPQTYRYGSFKIRLPPVRASGNPDTSLSNGIENLIFFLAACRLVGAIPLRAVVEGDDGIFQAIHSERLSVDVFKQVGAEVKMEIFTRAGDAGFCKLFWAEDGTLVPDIVRKLVRLPWTCGRYKHAGPNVMTQLYKAKVLSLQCEAPQCPILWKVCQHHLRLMERVRARFDEDDWYKQEILDFSLRASEPSLMARFYAWEKWGIDVTTQLRVEEAIERGDLNSELDPDLQYGLAGDSKYIDGADYIVDIPPFMRTPDVIY